MDSMRIIEHAHGRVVIAEIGDGRRRVTLEASEGVYVPRRTCETTYPIALIERFLALGFGWLCESIARDEDPTRVEANLRANLFPFIPPTEFAGRRLLDFGCGTGGSSVVLGRLLRATEIVGLELNAELLDLARARAEHHCLSNVRFLAAPGPMTVPSTLGAVDFIVFSAVFEHLLPIERQTLMPALWATLQPGGVLFVNQTPHRYFPIETHSTGLPFINYLPDRLAHWVTRHLARRERHINRSPVWEVHLRGGIRGATEREILRSLGGAAESLEPSGDGLRNRVDLWYSQLSPRYRAAKRLALIINKALYGTVGTILAPRVVPMAIRKA
jgi:SAM-dependent methyltransferase